MYHMTELQSLLYPLFLQELRGSYPLLWLFCYMWENLQQDHGNVTDGEVNESTIVHLLNSRSFFGKIKGSCTVAKFAEKPKRLLNSFDRQDYKRSPFLNDLRHQGWRILKTREVKVIAYKCLLSLCVGRSTNYVCALHRIWKDVWICSFKLKNVAGGLTRIMV